MAGGTIQRDDFRLLMADGLKVIFEEAYSKIALGQWQDLFNVETSEKAYEVELGLVGMGLPSLKAELEAPRVDSPKQGRPVKYVHNTYALETRLSVEAKNDDRYGKLSRMVIPEMIRNFKILQEMQHAAIFDLGFNVNGYEPDGVSLWSTAHPLIGGGTSSNRSGTDAALSVTSLANLRTIMRRTRTESGKLQPLMPTKLIVGPGQQQLAEELVLTPLKPGTTGYTTQPNDINYNYNKFDIKVWDYLDETLNPAAFYVAADKGDTKMKHFDREVMNSDTDIDKRVRAIVFLAFSRYSFGFSDWRGLAASHGS